MITKEIAILILFAVLCHGNDVEESMATLSENMLRQFHRHSNAEEVSKNQDEDEDVKREGIDKSVGVLSDSLLIELQSQRKEIETAGASEETMQVEDEKTDKETIDYEETDNIDDYYYGLDYNDNEEEGLADLLKDLGPDLLQNISPTLIIGFFESASPEDIENILDDPDFLFQLPPETIELVVQKLPTEIIIQIVSTKGVKDLLLHPPEDLEEAQMFQTFQTFVSSVLIARLDVSAIGTLPEFLIKSQLKNEKLLVEILKFPEKLFSLVTNFPDILNEVSAQVVLSILEKNTIEQANVSLDTILTTFQHIPEEVYSSLIGRVLPEISQSLIVTLLKDVSSENMSQIINSLPNNIIIKLMNNQKVQDLFVNTPLDGTSELELKELEEIKNNVVLTLFEKLNADIIASLPEVLLKAQLMNEGLLVKLFNFPSKLLSVIKSHPQLLNEVPNNVITNILEKEDVDGILGNVPAHFISQIVMDVPGFVLRNFTMTIVRRLPSKVIIKIANSKAVEEIFRNSIEDLENQKFSNSVAEIAPILFDKLEVPYILLLPKFLIKSQLRNEKLLLELFKFPSKLLSVVKAFPELLNDVPSSVFTNILQEKSGVLNNISPRALSEVFKEIPKQVLTNLIKRLVSQIPPKELLSSVESIWTETFSQILSELPESVVANIVSSIPSNILLQISSDPALINKLQPSDIENLVDKVPTDQLKLFLAHGILADQNILQKVPPAVITKVARNQELLSLISDDNLLMVANIFPDLLGIIPVSSIVHIAKTRPWTIGMLPISFFTSLSSSRLHDILSSLSDQDIVNLLTFKPALVNIVAGLPTKLLVKILHSRQLLISKIPSVAEPFISQLLVDEKLIRKLPVSLLASLAGVPGVEKLVSKFAVISILRAHPSLPTLIQPSLLKPFVHFLSDPWFRTTLPCATISLMSKKAASIVDIIPPSVMEKVITSRRILSCIPASDLENMMDQRLKLSRLSMVSLLRGARQLPTEKYSMGMIYNFMKQQV